MMDHLPLDDAHLDPTRRRTRKQGFQTSESLDADLPNAAVKPVAANCPSITSLAVKTCEDLTECSSLITSGRSGSPRPRHC